jgi:hypothetical protein
VNVLGALPENTGVWYVNNYVNDVSEAVLRDLRFGIWIAAEGYFVNGAYDLSADGSRVLLRVIPPTTERTYKMYIYDTRYPANDRLIDDFDAYGVIAGSFAPSDETKLWLFNEVGVVQYDILTGETTILDESLNASEATAVTIDNPAIFSPDGRYLAALAQGGLYLVDLTDEAAMANTTAQATTTSEPTGLLRLHLTVDCPHVPVETITWHVRNPKEETVTVRWVLQRSPTNETATLEVPGGSEAEPGVGTFETDTWEWHYDMMRIYVNDIFHDARECFVPSAG